MIANLPKPIANYVEANSRLDVDGMLHAFSPDAVVQDDGGRHQGHPELRRWIEESIVASKAVFTPDAVRHDGGQVVVEGLTFGAFKGSPLRFTLRFTLEGDAIRALEISL